MAGQFTCMNPNLKHELDCTRLGRRPSFLMGKSVRFLETLEGPSTIKGGSTVGILRKPQPLRADSTGPHITRIYHGGSKVDAHNLFDVYRDLTRTLQSGSYRPKTSEGASELTCDSPTSQEVEYPTCLESYSVLNTVLRVQIDEHSSQAPPADPNQLLLWAKRDLLAYKSTEDILESRVTIQILRAVDFLFYADASRQTINADSAKFFLEEALAGITGEMSSKPLLGICLHIFNHIHLPQLLDKSLVLRLLQVLHTKANTTRSAALNAEFVATCKTMFRHQKAVLVENAHLWIPLVMDTLFDQSSYIRLQGTQFILELARQKLTAISNEIFNYLNTKVESVEPPADGSNSNTNVTNLEIAVRRMINLIETPSEVKQTFYMWSTLLLFMGSNPQTRLETWPQLSEWLEVPRYGFSNTSLSVKECTYNAWKNVIYLFLFRYDNNLSITRNIVSLLNPIKPKKQISLAIFERFCNCFDVALFIALRTCDNITKHWDIAFEYLIAPNIKFMLEHPSTQVKKVGYQYLVSLFSLPTGVKTSRDRVLDDKAITSQEIGGVPKQWIKGNVGQIVELLSLAAANNIGFDQVSKQWASYVGLIRQVSSADDDALYSHLLACVNFLKQTAQIFSPAENKRLFSTFVCSFNYSVLVAARYKINLQGHAEVVSRGAGPGQVSCAILMISNTTHLDAAEFDEVLTKFTTVMSRQVAIMAKIILSKYKDYNSACDGEDQRVQQNALKHMIRLLQKPNFGFFEEEDVQSTLSVLDLWTAKEISQDWRALFTSAFNKADYPELFSDYLAKFSQFDEYFDCIFEFKKSLFVDVDAFDELLLHTALKKAPAKLEPSFLAEYPKAFKTYVGRYFFATLESDKLETAINILGNCAIKDCADIVLEAISNGDQRASELWQLLYVDQCPEGEYTPAAKARARDLQQEGKLILPTEIPPRASSKRALDTLETQSELPRTPTKRLKHAESHIPSPPVSSDVSELLSSPPSLKSGTDPQLLMKLLHPAALTSSVMGLQKHQLNELRSRLEESLELVNAQLRTKN